VHAITKHLFDVSAKMSDPHGTKIASAVRSNYHAIEHMSIECGFDRDDGAVKRPEGEGRQREGDGTGADRKTVPAQAQPAQAQPAQAWPSGRDGAPRHPAAPSGGLWAPPAAGTGGPTAEITGAGPTAEITGAGGPAADARPAGRRTSKANSARSRSGTRPDPAHQARPRRGRRGGRVAGRRGIAGTGALSAQGLSAPAGHAGHA